MAKEELQNGTIIGVSGGSNGVIQPSADGSLKLVKTRFIDLELVTAIILSCGIVAALLLFIYLSFIYPSAASVVIPLVISPVASLILNMLSKRQQKKDADATIKTALKIANNAADQRPTQLS